MRARHAAEGNQGQSVGRGHEGAFRGAEGSLHRGDVAGSYVSHESPVECLESNGVGVAAARPLVPMTGVLGSARMRFAHDVIPIRA